MGQKVSKTIVLVGMMGAGKSAVGRALSDCLSVPFEDSDHAIEVAANATISEIFARDGEAFFRKRECEVIERLLQNKPMVLSVGGGAYLQDKTRQVIDRGGVVLWLDAPMDVLWERVRHKDTRPLLLTDNPYKTLYDLYNARVPIYKKAQLRLKIDGAHSITQTMHSALETLGFKQNTLASTVFTNVQEEKK